MLNGALCWQYIDRIESFDNALLIKKPLVFSSEPLLNTGSPPALKQASFCVQMVVK